jgi:ethanolamine utilization protein EutN
LWHSAQTVFSSLIFVIFFMILARVIGNAVATQKNERYVGGRLLLVQPVTPDGTPVGSSFLALDGADAGEGDLTLVVQEGWSASTAATHRSGAAIDAAIVGVVDACEPFPPASPE